MIWSAEALHYGWLSQLLLWSTNGRFFLFRLQHVCFGYMSNFVKKSRCTCIIRIEGNFTLRWWHYKAMFVTHTCCLCNVLCCPSEMLGEKCRHDLHDGAIAGGWTTLSIEHTIRMWSCAWFSQIRIILRRTTNFMTVRHIIYEMFWLLFNKYSSQFGTALDNCQILGPSAR